MPTNVPPQYVELEQQYKAERDLHEKLRIAQELLRIMPKHKGTDRLQADMKTRIAKLRKEIDSQARSGGKSGAHQWDHIPREGAGQIILIGPPNSGKSSLLDVGTNAEPVIADYPMSTREPLAGMWPFETVQLQFIDTPPLAPDHIEGYLFNLIRQANLVALVADLGQPNGVTELTWIAELLAEKRIHLVTTPSDDNALHHQVRTVIIGHKSDEPSAADVSRALTVTFPDLPMITTSLLDDASIEALPRWLFEQLRVIRVYTKEPGHPVELVDPVVLPVGGTVTDAATAIHRDIAANLQYARAWGGSFHDGQRVQRDQVLSDGDIVEFHAR